MAEFTAKDVQRLRQATGAGMMDAKKRARGERRRLRAGRRSGCARRASPRPTSAPTARTRRARSPAVVDGNVGAIVQLKCETDFTAKTERVTSLVGELAELVVAEGRGRGRRARQGARGPQDHHEGEHRGRHGRALRGRRPTTSSTPTCTCRTAAASTPCSSSSAGGDQGARPRHRRAHRLHQAAVPHP